MGALERYSSARETQFQLLDHQFLQTEFVKDLSQSGTVLPILGVNLRCQGLFDSIRIQTVNDFELNLHLKVQRVLWTQQWMPFQCCEKCDAKFCLLFLFDIFDLGESKDSFSKFPTLNVKIGTFRLFLSTTWLPRLPLFHDWLMHLWLLTCFQWISLTSSALFCSSWSYQGLQSLKSSCTALSGENFDIWTNHDIMRPKLALTQEAHPPLRLIVKFMLYVIGPKFTSNPIVISVAFCLKLLQLCNPQEIGE